MFRTFKYRAYPTAVQERTLRTWLAVTRWVYNCALEHRYEGWKHASLRERGSEERKSMTVTRFSQTKELTEARAQIQSLAEVPYTIVRDTSLLRADRAFQAWLSNFKQGHGRPKFKGRNFWKSVRTEQPTDIKLSKDRVRFPKVGWIRMSLHRPVAGVPRTGTLSLEADGWYVSIGCDGVPERSFKASSREIPVHLGVRKMIHFGNSRAVPNPKNLIRSEEKLKRLQRVASRRVKGSNRWRKQKALVAKLHQTIVRQRDHFLHKWSHRLAVRYGLIGIEEWEIKKLVERDPGDGMTELRKRIHDVAWYKFRQMLGYKMAEAKRVLFAFKGEKTTQTCSNCLSEKDPPIPLSVLVYKCDKCGIQIDREENAVRNIRRLMEEAKQVPRKA